MFETLQGIDSAVFVFINQTLANPLTDFSMPIITNDTFLRVGFAVAVLLLLWKGDNRLRRAALVSIVVLLIGDYISSSIIKPLVGRIRPCNDPLMLANLHLLVNCGSGKSFPSSHATTAFTVAFFFWRVTPRVTRFAQRVIAGVMIVATLIALSRVFVGVHYPLDILSGGLLGGVVGCSLGRVNLWGEKIFFTAPPGSKVL